MKTQSIFTRLLPIILAAALLLAGCRSMQYQTAAEDVRAIADGIAGYSLPEGYREQFGLELLGYQMVSLTGPTEACHIYLVQAPKDAEADIARLQEQADTMRGEKNGRQRSKVRVVEQRLVTIRGQQVPLLVGEGVNSEDQPYREVTALFTARGGLALVSISAPESLWDEALVDQFLASIE